MQKEFVFNGKVFGESKQFIVEAPIENGGVVTSNYCPQDLLTGGLSFVSAINGESEDEFVTDCKSQIAAMEFADTASTLLDAHIGGLMATVMAHLNRCGRLIFGDLLIYIDCFALLLKADGFSDTEIRDIYPKITRSIVELYPNYVVNTTDLSPFKGSHFDFVLFNVSHK